ncbi:UNVERIFIED_CONTAM: hypothetical protein Slati_4570600 [Sesamum latifolium]|uniref:Uncharacterized protein n=1 Tax=Sesamum latifolium TaxID=2727402 RepID=A0AAW2SFK3_9LAMI
MLNFSNTLTSPIGKAYFYEFLSFSHHPLVANLVISYDKAPGVERKELSARHTTKELTNGLVTAAEGNEDEDGFPEKPALIVTARCPYELYVRLKCALPKEGISGVSQVRSILKLRVQGKGVGSKFLARLEAKFNSLTATSIPYDRPDERFAKTGIHSSWLARSGKRTAGNPRSLDVTGAGAGQKTKPGMSRIALPKSHILSLENSTLHY